MIGKSSSFANKAERCSTLQNYRHKEKEINNEKRKGEKKSETNKKQGQETENHRSERDRNNEKAIL
jgi:hypothetical protein